jgi:hypothetical protein
MSGILSLLETSGPVIGLYMDFLNLPTQKIEMQNKLELYPKDLTKLATIAHSPESVQYAIHAYFISLTNILSSTPLLFPDLR